MPDATLRIHDQAGSRLVVLDKAIFTIGRRGASDLYCASADVSREHATISREGDAYVLRDSDSRFGTYVNGARVVEHILVSGDYIRLGRSALELVFETGETSRSGLTEPSSNITDLRQLVAIMDGLRALGSGRVLEEVLALVVDAALQVTGAQRGFVMLGTEQGDLTFRVARGPNRQPLTGDSFSTSTKIPQAVFTTGKSQLINDLRGVPDHDQTILGGIRHVMCVPLRAMRMGMTAQPTADGDARRIIGVLYLDGSAQHRKSAALSSLEAFATQAALAIESARLYAEADEKARLDRELHVAADIQRALLADPTYTGALCDLAAASLPCRTVGGDFYDYLELEGGGFSFALGDVAGKGPPAALLAAATQSHFVAQASLGADPAQTVGRINRALIRRMIEARFATLFHGVLMRDGRLSYCNAGHEPPIVVGEDGVKGLETGGPVLGLFGNARYASDSIQLKPDDLVVICSDGVTDALNVSGDHFGRTRLLDAVVACRDAAADTVLDGLLEKIRTFSRGAAQADDITVLVLKCRGVGVEESGTVA
jgi:serine phosphatase RsbU (regulator of sigma subunit)/pSer/pThr/pTyr-binding forkhead associated (FHA) protein